MAYKPFVEKLENYEKIKIALHISGPLLEWIADNEPGFMDTLAHLCGEGRIEFISGGFYEPILPAIPTWDAIDQVRYMNSWIFDRFGFKPKGAWLAERAWEPHVPSVLSGAQIEYSFLDDFHFFGAGVAPAFLKSYHITEDQNKTVKIFPISKKLRYAVPFHSVEEALSIIKEPFSDLDEDSVSVLFDDGEKFGTWPGTYDHVYKNGWIDSFFSAISDDAEIDMILPSEALTKLSSAGTTYFPSSSYFELTQWCLPTETRIKAEYLTEELKNSGSMEKYEGMFRGGFWRNYLSKYPESNHLNKRVASFSKTVFSEGGGLEEARIDIFKAQCNCGYWHGIFGGIYLPHLRESLYKNLLSAENKFYREKNKEEEWSSADMEDINSDGKEEIIYRDSKTTAVIVPSKGGMITELSDRETLFNFANLLSRREEAYHRFLKEPNNTGENGISTIHDRYVLKDEDAAEFLYFDTDLQGIFFETVSYEKDTEDIFRNGIVFDSRKVNRNCFVRKEEKKWIFDFNADNHSLFRLKNTKTIESCRSIFGSSYELENNNETCLYFRCFVCLSVPEAFSEKRYFTVPGEEEPVFPGMKKEFKGDTIVYTDRVVGAEVHISFSPAVDWLLTPSYSVNLSEGGFEKNIQSVVISAGRWFCRDRNEKIKSELKIINGGGKWKWI